jgi:hypothetical protein
MPIFNREDGDVIHSDPAMRKIIPYIMPTRNQAAVYFEQLVDLTKTLPYLEKLNAARGKKEYTLFQVVLCALARTFGERPQLNRFVVGRRIYMRKNIEFSFAIKKAFTDEAEMATTKIAFLPDETLHTVAQKTTQNIGLGKSDYKSQSDKETSLIMKLPRFAVRLLIGLQRTLDYFNLLPNFMIKDDPLYCSVFLANLGSVGLDSAYHHLYEYGNCPFFAVVGKMKKAVVATPEGAVVVKDVVSIKFTFDERITDGLYCSKSLERFKRYVENPELLESFAQAVGEPK